MKFRTISVHYTATIALLAATLLGAAWSDHRPPAVLAKPIERIGLRIGGWVSDGDQQLRETIVASLNATSYISRTYKRDRSQLDFFMAFYAQPRTGESMHSPKYCLPGGGWDFTEFTTVSIPTAEGPVRINQARIRRGDERQLVYYWYESRARIVASEYQSKLFLVWDGLTRGNQGGAIVRVIVPDRPEAQQEAMAFAGEVIPEVRRCFGSD